MNIRDQKLIAVLELLIWVYDKVEHWIWARASRRVLALSQEHLAGPSIIN